MVLLQNGETPIRSGASVVLTQGGPRPGTLTVTNIAIVFETSGAPFKSRLTPARKREIESMARAAMTDERAKISLRVPRRDLTRLKSRALQEGIPYQTLINALIHRYVSD